MSRVLLILFLLLCSPPIGAAEVDYSRDVRPLLVEKCAVCHGALKQESGLRLDVGRLIVRGGESGPAVQSGAAGASLLIRRVTAADPADRMPPEGEGGSLDAKQIGLLRQWIDAGAVVPADEVIPAGPDDHWAYQPPRRSEIPNIVHVNGPGNVIDAYISRQYEAQGLVPVQPADKATLLRRLYLDLIGLPPAADELHTFLADESADAYEKVVDRLLDSPLYGERWGRHWMDVWRYSDWDGFKNQLRGSQRHIWRWRDWIVESLNTDKGYDRMIVEMLAGDELAPEDHQTLRATGFLARNYHHSNRNIWLDATVEHTAKAFLGLTINCARCHDHKYDPVAQREYYAFRAIFEPHKVRTERLPGEPDLIKNGLARTFDAEPEAVTYVFLAGNDKHPDKDHPVDPGVPALFGKPLTVEPVSLPTAAYVPGLEDFIEREETAKATRELQQSRTAWTKAEADAEAQRTSATSDDLSSTRPPPPTIPRAVPLTLQVARLKASSAQSRLFSLEARWAADKAKHLTTNENPEERARWAAAKERDSNLRAGRLAVLQKQLALQQAAAEDKTDAAKHKAALDKARKDLNAAENGLRKAQEQAQQNDSQYTPVAKAYPSSSTGRRLALARWIANPENPLTARVAVNHIWLRHFGEPLVDNTFDFGLRSPRPVHADLLDWLSAELMENRWSMKHLHRLIVTSQTYRLASAGDSAATTANAAADRDNRFLWRQNVRRLDAEVIRDSMLHVADRLDLTQGGPEFEFTEGERITRRSLYFGHAYEKQMPMLVLFDTASPNECYRRSESIIPQQALALANSTLSLECARRLATSINETATDPAEFLQQACQQILSRPPTPEETSTCLAFLEAQAERLADPSVLTSFASGEETAVKPAGDPALRARENLVHVLMNHNDFVTVR